jgi:hypothetical protein
VIAGWSIHESFDTTADYEGARIKLRGQGFNTSCHIDATADPKDCLAFYYRDAFGKRHRQRHRRSYLAK